MQKHTEQTPARWCADMQVVTGFAFPATCAQPAGQYI